MQFLRMNKKWINRGFWQNFFQEYFILTHYDILHVTFDFYRVALNKTTFVENIQGLHLFLKSSLISLILKEFFVGVSSILDFLSCVSLEDPHCFMALPVCRNILYHHITGMRYSAFERFMILFYNQFESHYIQINQEVFQERMHE